MFRLSALLLSLLVTAPIFAQIPVKIYAQELVDRTVARNPDLQVIVMHVTPPKAAGNIIIASNIGRIGKAADEDDLRVIDTGKPNIEVGHGGTRFEVELPLQDVSGSTIGALGLVWPYSKGQDKSRLIKKAQQIRDALGRRVLNAANLLDPYPLEPLATTRTYAQRLVEEAFARHRDVTVLALRGPAPASGDIIVVGSTFGRHGKKADADDLKILDSAEPATGIYSNGKRFGVDLRLQDRSGNVVGTMNVGYAWKEGDDKYSLVAKAVQLREEIQQRIASGAQLAELDTH